MVDYVQTFMKKKHELVIKTIFHHHQKLKIKYN